MISDARYSRVPLGDEGGGGGAGGRGGDGGGGGDNFVTMQLHEQRRAMAQQDDALEMLSRSVTRIGDASLAISHELDDQNKMLSELDDVRLFRRGAWCEGGRFLSLRCLPCDATRVIVTSGRRDARTRAGGLWGTRWMGRAGPRARI